MNAERMNGNSRAAISIIVPCWRDTELALARAEIWSQHPAISDVVLSGVATHRPAAISSSDRITWCETLRPSRGEQMNCGAAHARGDVFLFQHVDSDLTATHLDALADALKDPSVHAGGFYRKFDQRHPLLRRLEVVERVHNRLFGTIYGDQSLFVRREIFEALGGFAAIPLMEDMELSRRLRRAGKIIMLDPPMSSSPQRQIEQGPWRVTLRNLFFVVGFRAGISPHRLHRWYYSDEATTLADDGAASVQEKCPRATALDSRWQARWNAFRHPIDNERRRSYGNAGIRCRLSCRPRTKSAADI